MSALGQAGGTADNVDQNAGAGGGQAGGSSSGGTGDLTVPEFLKGVDHSLASAPSVKNFTNMNDFVKSYIHAQSMIGADKIVVPKAGADEKAWNDVFRKLGVPEKLEEYDVKLNEKSKLDVQHFNKLKEAMHKNGLLPHQAKALVSLMESEAEGFEKALLDQRKQQVESNLGELKKEWGAAYDERATIAAKAASKIGGPDFIKYLDETGLGDDPKLIKVFAEVGKIMGESGHKGEGSAGRKTPEELKSRLSALTTDINSPYYDKNSPQHTSVRQEVEKIYQELYSTEK